MDRIVAVDGQPVRTGEDVIHAAREKSLDTPTRYSVESAGKIRELVFPTVKFNLMDFSLAFLIMFLGGGIIFCLGFVVYLLKPNTHTSWVFFFSTVVVGTYMFTGFDVQATLLLAPLNYLTGPLSPATLFHIGSVFPERKHILNRYPKLEYLVYFPALALAFLFNLQYFTFLKFSSSGLLRWIPDVRQITSMFRLFTLLCTIGMVLMILHSLFRASTTVARQRARVVLFGVGIAWLIPAMIMLSVHFLKVTFPWNFLVFFIILFPAAIAYSIVKHNLFDADTIIRRTVGYIVVTAVVVTVYILVSLSFNMILGTYEVAQSRGFPIVFTLVIVLIFNPMKNRIQSLVDRIFFRKEYDHGKIIDKISNAITSLLDLGQILKQMIRTFMEDMFINTSSVMLLNPAGTEYQVYLADGERREEIEKVILQKDEPLIRIIEKEKKELTKYDVLEDPKYRTICEDCARNFETLNSSLMVPLVFQDKVIGLLNLGEKKSGKFYNREDINFLHTLARQGAVAIENARLFEENIEKSRMEEELKIAHNIQLSMLPDRAPTIKGFSIAARCIPAREVGGDFYDFIEIEDNGAKRLVIVVGDVSGKAVSGALVMAASRSILRVLTETHASVEEVMNMGNTHLHRDIKKGMFVALLYVVLDPQEKTLTLSNAGQVQPIIFSSGKSKPEYIDTEGDRFPLGIIKECHYQEMRVSLKQWDILVFYTDGMVEAINEKGELYGFERFLKSIEEGRELGADELLEKLINDVMLYAGKVEQHDDLTAVVVKVD
jgi:serine phosphatase RsbU (regulator of sigma subunit)